MLDRLPEGIEAELPRLRVLERFPDGAALVTLPRYDDFKDHAAAVARRGATFVEIAGNRGPILVTALVPRAGRRRSRARRRCSPSPS